MTQQQVIKYIQSKKTIIPIVQSNIKLLTPNVKKRYLQQFEKNRQIYKKVIKDQIKDPFNDLYDIYNDMMQQFRHLSIMSINNEQIRKVLNPQFEQYAKKIGMTFFKIKQNRLRQLAGLNEIHDPHPVMPGIGNRGQQLQKQGGLAKSILPFKSRKVYKPKKSK